MKNYSYLIEFGLYRHNAIRECRFVFFVLNYLLKQITNYQKSTIVLFNYFVVQYVFLFLMVSVCNKFIFARETRF